MKAEFTVSDMTCNHCVQAITQAVHELEPNARLDIDLASKKVVISDAQDIAALAAAIQDEGYDVQPLAQ